MWKKILLTLAVYFGINIVLSCSVGAIVLLYPKSMAITVGAITIASSVGAILFARYNRYATIDKTMFTTSKIRILVPALVAMAGMQVLMSYLTEVLDWYDLSLAVIASIVKTPFGFATVVLVGPVLEEVIFRGVIQSNARARNSGTVAIVISSAIFAVCHINPAQLIPTFAFGLLLGWAYEITGSLTVSSLMHILNNAICAAYIYIYGYEHSFDSVFSNVPAALAVSAAAVAASVWAIVRLTRSRTEVE